jgi:hypothetical protein
MDEFQLQAVQIWWIHTAAVPVPLVETYLVYSDFYNIE